MKTSHLLLPGVAALAALAACATGEVIAQSSSPASGRHRPCLPRDHGPHRQHRARRGLARRRHAARAGGLSRDGTGQGLQHPRWVYTLPNGDVLVAESNSPPPKDGAKNVHAEGLRGKVMGWVMKRAGAGVPSADRITLLRDADGDGVAEVRTVFLSGLFSPFGMALVGNELFIANADGIVKVPYQAGQTTSSAAGEAGGPMAGANHHWTKNVIASPDGRKLYATVGSNSNIGDNGMASEEGRAAIWKSTAPPAPSACSRPACAIPTGSAGSRRRARCGPW